MQKLVKISFICMRIKPLFSYQCLCTYLCFETEANLRSNSEMSYSLKLHRRKAFYGTKEPLKRLSVWGKSKKNREKRERGRACRQTFGTTIPRHLLCLKLLLARTLSVDRFNKHCLFCHHVTCILNNRL